MAFDPEEKMSGIMKTKMNTRVFFKMFQKRQVTVVIRFLEDVLEIAARLVRVNKQGEMEILGHGDSFSLKHDNKRRKFMSSNRRFNETNAQLKPTTAFTEMDKPSATECGGQRAG